MVSTTLVRHAAAGDTVLLGPARGEMTGRRRAATGDLLCVAGGTGLAPIKAIIEERGRWAAAAAGRPRRITLFAGARRQRGPVRPARPAAAPVACPGLQVIPVLSDELTGPATGPAWIAGCCPDVVRAHGLFENCEAYICGPEADGRADHAAAGRARAGRSRSTTTRCRRRPGLAPAPAAAAPPADIRTSLSAKFARPGFAARRPSSPKSPGTGRRTRRSAPRSPPRRAAGSSSR